MQVLRKLYEELRNNQELKSFLELITHITQKYKNMDPVNFEKVPEHRLIVQKLKKIKIDKIQQLFNLLPCFPHITALILKSSQLFTLAFIMIPEKCTFNWHDHQNMSGFTRALCGDIQIISINPKLFEPIPGTQQSYIYPLQAIRREILSSKKQSVSLIDPVHYNIHKIIPVGKNAAFLDLLIPEYPQNGCICFEQIQAFPQFKQYLNLKKANSQCNEIVGLDKLIQFFKSNSI